MPIPGPFCDIPHMRGAVSWENLITSAKREGLFTFLGYVRVTYAFVSGHGTPVPIPKT